MSISSSTLARSASRKYSAMVSAVRPARQRAPGGSFIWPNTSAVCFSTSASRSSSSSSWPSRERSPMPANTEMPEWRSTVVRISSMISTVLPTPAPPNIAALPPFTSGASRSITLMPVWNGSTEASSRSMPGAGAWIGCVAMSVGSGAAAVHRRRRSHRAAGRAPACRPARGSGRSGGARRGAAAQAGGLLQDDAAHRGGSRCCCTSAISGVPRSQSISTASCTGRQRAGRKAQIDHRAVHGDHPAGCGIACVCVVRSHQRHSLPADRIRVPVRREQR